MHAIAIWYFLLRMQLSCDVFVLVVLVIGTVLHVCQHQDSTTARTCTRCVLKKTIRAQVVWWLTSVGRKLPRVACRTVLCRSLAVARFGEKELLSP